MISKNELKKRQNARAQAEKKAAKAAEKPAGAAGQGKSKEQSASAADEEEGLSEQAYYERRSKTILALRESKQPDPYPHKFHVSISLTDFIAQFDAAAQPGSTLKDESQPEKNLVSVAGRIHNARASSSKLRFYDLHGEGVKIQIMANAQEHQGKAGTPEGYAEVHDLLRRGDIVGVKGYRARRRRASCPSSRSACSSSARTPRTPQGAGRHGQGRLTNQEQRYRKRYWT